MKWKYKNETGSTIIWEGHTWAPEKEKEISHPAPEFLGLTCTQQGNIPDPVLFDENIMVNAGETKEIAIPAPVLSRRVTLSVLRKAGNGVLLCFNSADNKKIAIDATQFFMQTLSWTSCGKIYLESLGDESIIYISVIEEA